MGWGLKLSPNLAAFYPGILVLNHFAINIFRLENHKKHGWTNLCFISRTGSVQSWSLPKDMKLLVQTFVLGGRGKSASHGMGAALESPWLREESHSPTWLLAARTQPNHEPRLTCFFIFFISSLSFASIIFQESEFLSKFYKTQLVISDCLMLAILANSPLNADGVWL